MLKQYVHGFETALESSEMQGAKLFLVGLGIDPIFQDVLVLLLLVASVLNEELQLLMPHLQSSVVKQSEAALVSDLHKSELKILESHRELIVVLRFDLGCHQKPGAVYLVVRLIELRNGLGSC